MKNPRCQLRTQCYYVSSLYKNAYFSRSSNLEGLITSPDHRGRFGRGGILYRYRLQLSRRLWVRLPLPTGQFSEISLSACNVRRGWFIGIECDLGPVDMGSIPSRFIGLHRVMNLSKLCTHTCVLANQAIHPVGVGKFNWYRKFVGGNSALSSVRDGEVGG